MGNLTIPVTNVGQVSDGYHTFEELYSHRYMLFICLMKSNPSISWRANNHDDGSSFTGYFIAGMELPTGNISYHLPIGYWNHLDYSGIRTSNKAPKWDGHTSEDVVNRLNRWIIENHCNDGGGNRKMMEIADVPCPKCGCIAVVDIDDCTDTRVECPDCGSVYTFTYSIEVVVNDIELINNPPA